MRPKPRCESGQAIRMAASEPTVPGALGAKPQPNQVAKAQAGLFRMCGKSLVIGLAIGRRICGGGDDVFFHRPVAQVDFPAALATEGCVGIREFDGSFADWTLHRAGIWFGITKPGAAAMLTSTGEGAV